MFVESCLVMLEDIMSLIQTLSSDVIDTIVSLIHSQLLKYIPSLLNRLSAWLASFLRVLTLALDVLRNAAYLKDYLKGLIGRSHAVSSTQFHQVQAEQTGKGDSVKEPTPLDLGNTNEEYSERSTEAVIDVTINPSLIRSRFIDTEVTDYIKARSACKSPMMRMGTRPLRQSPTDVDFFDIDSKIYNTMRRQRLTSMPKIKHGISALKPVAYEAPIHDIHDLSVNVKVCSVSQTPKEVVDFSNTASITEPTPHRMVELKDEVKIVNTKQQSPKKKSLAKRIRKFLTPKKLISFGRNLKNPYITMANKYCNIFS
ncbi:unnamed protein product [Owenia fusiformis]|uniref:Uncharacterized protein n=1 Tax=Owenia fusiformis TaxID=6347 RepID=A0A8J1XNS0_OWEFU|nr:unnamed protein product [Owenia fusiformis]